LPCRCRRLLCKWHLRRPCRVRRIIAASRCGLLRWSQSSQQPRRCPLLQWRRRLRRASAVHQSYVSPAVPAIPPVDEMQCRAPKHCPARGSRSPPSAKPKANGAQLNAQGLDVAPDGRNLRPVGLREGPDLAARTCPGVAPAPHCGQAGSSASASNAERYFHPLQPKSGAALARFHMLWYFYYACWRLRMQWKIGRHSFPGAANGSAAWAQPTFQPVPKPPESITSPALSRPRRRSVIFFSPYRADALCWERSRAGRNSFAPSLWGWRKKYAPFVSRRHPRSLPPRPARRSTRQGLQAQYPCGPSTPSRKN